MWLYERARINFLVRCFLRRGFIFFLMFTVGSLIFISSSFGQEDIFTLGAEQGDGFLLNPREVKEGPDGNIYVLDWSDAFIKVYSPDGKLGKKITRDYEPLPVSKKDKERYAQRSLDRMTSPIFTEDIKKKIIPLIKYPKYKPAYLRFNLLENGWLLVLVDYTEDEHYLLDIFDQEGKYIAQFKTQIPAEGMLAGFLSFKNGKAYAVANEEDYMFVKRYSIEIQEYTDGKWIRKKM